MNKKGANLLIAAVVLVLIGIAVTIITLASFNREVLSRNNNEMENNETNSSLISNVSNNTSSQSIPKVCSDYTNQATCQSDAYNLSNSSHKCEWNSNSSSCSLAAKKNESAELFVDLTASNLHLENAGCTEESNITNSSCDIEITGSIKNIGTAAVNEEFLVHFLDTSNGVSLIESVHFTESLAPQEEKNITITYDNQPYGTYFIQFKVDGTNSIAEANENNNIKSDAIVIP